MSQHEQPKPNRAARRKAARALRKAVKASRVGVGANVTGYRVVAADGSVKLQVGAEPGERP